MQWDECRKLDMVLANSIVETEPVDLKQLQSIVPDVSWLYCLWGVDATRAITVECPLNEMHLLMFLIARIRAAATNTPKSMRLNCPQALVSEKPFKQQTLQELMDNVQNLQMMWSTLLRTETVDTLYDVLDACMLRFGELALRARPAAELDCDDMVECLTDGQRQLSNACIRRLTAFFFAAYRHVHITACRTELPIGEPLDFELHDHLLSAAQDDFNVLCMYFDVPLAAVLQYRHEFSGMFHSVTQVMYYNNPSYVRRIQLPWLELCKGDKPEHLLPLILQLYPDIIIIHEDEPLPNGFAIPGSVDDDVALPRGADKWAWLVFSGSIHLVSATGHLFYSANLIPLVNLLHRQQ